MPKTTLNPKKTNKQKPMQLTTEQKEKFLAYLEKKGLPAPKTSEPEPKDLFNWCAKDIISRLDFDSLNQKGINNSVQEVEGAIFRFLILESLKFAIENAPKEEAFIESLNFSETATEIMGLIEVKTNSDPDFSLFISKGLCIAYVSKCFELQILADPAIIALLFN